MTKKYPKNPLRERLLDEAEKMVKKRGAEDPGPDAFLTPQVALVKGWSLQQYIDYLNAFLEPVCHGLGIAREDYLLLDRMDQALAFLVYDRRLSPLKATLCYVETRLSGTIGNLRAMLKKRMATGAPPLYIALHKEPTSRGADWGTYYLTNQNPETDTKRANTKRAGG